MSQEQTGTVPLVLMVIIVNRERGERLAEIFAANGVAFSLLTLGRGTADKSILCYLGLGETKKEILYSCMPYELSQIILKRLDSELNLKRPGKGIAFSIPINGIADEASRKRLQGSTQLQGETVMEQSSQYDLIVAVTNQGYANEVMEAAKPSGANCGTILHARGAGMKQAERFFGISIQPEKEMVLILVKKEIRQGIMTAIAEKKGLHTDAKTIVFSLPVNGVAGLPADS